MGSARARRGVPRLQPPLLVNYRASHGRTAAKDIPLTVTGRERERMRMSSRFQLAVRRFEGSYAYEDCSAFTAASLACLPSVRDAWRLRGRPPANGPRSLAHADLLRNCGHVGPRGSREATSTGYPRPETAQHGVTSASVTFRMVNGIVAPATNRRACCSKRSLKASFPSMERGHGGSDVDRL